MKMTDYQILKAASTAGYALIDSGEGEKLERFGDFTVSRPDPQALWPKRQDRSIWEKSDAFFSTTGRGGWQTRRTLPDHWPIEYAGLKFWIKLSAFKHTGIFPEHAPSWVWLQDKIKDAKRPIKVLNLFGYTGGASLAAARAGAAVTHLDASKVAVSWARDNAALSDLAAKPIRWLVDDGLSFVKRELRRKNYYEGIIMDPPAFGRGPKGEVWKIEENFLELLSSAHELLSSKPLLFLVNGYASGYSAIAYKNNLETLTRGRGGPVEFGELTISELDSPRLLPGGIFARWSA